MTSPDATCLIKYEHLKFDARIMFPMNDKMIVHHV